MLTDKYLVLVNTGYSVLHYWINEECKVGDPVEVDIMGELYHGSISQVFDEKSVMDAPYYDLPLWEDPDISEPFIFKSWFPSKMKTAKLRKEAKA